MNSHVLKMLVMTTACFNGFAVAANAQSDQSSAARCPVGYSLISTVCIQSNTGDVVTARDVDAAERPCPSGYWATQGQCVNLSTGDVDQAPQATADSRKE